MQRPARIAEAVVGWPLTGPANRRVFQHTRRSHRAEDGNRQGAGQTQDRRGGGLCMSRLTTRAERARVRAVRAGLPQLSNPAGGAAARRASLEKLESRTLFSAIVGTVFLDANANGLRDNNEPGL